MSLSYFVLGFCCLGFVFSCPPLPDIENGNLQVLSPVSVKVVCHPSFRYLSSNQHESEILRCKKGQWSDPHPQCIQRKFHCPLLNTKIPHGKVVFFGNYEAHTVVRYICETNYALVGNEERVCQDKVFEWTGYEPECKAKLLDVVSKIKDNFVDKLANYSGLGRVIDVGVEKQGLDLFLVFDKSSSIHPDHFDKAIEFAQFLVSRFNVSNGPKTKVGGTRLAVVTFGNEAKLEIKLDDPTITSVDEVKERLETIKCGQLCDGETNMNEAMQVILKMVTSAARPEAKKAMFLTSDGAPTGRSPFGNAGKVRDQDVEIFAVGVGDDIDKHTLDRIATQPSGEHVFFLKSFNDFNEIMEIIHGGLPKVSEQTGPPDKCGYLSEKGRAALNTSEIQTKVGAWPWLASILYINSDYQVSFHCNGILICRSWVLTSAECLFKNRQKIQADELIIVLGDDDLTVEEKSEQNLLVSQVYVHDEFDINAQKIRYNLGLIKLSTEADLNDNVRTVCLITDEYWSRKPETKGHMIGWLMNKEELNRIPNQLAPIVRPSQAEMSILGRIQCESYLKGNYSKKDSDRLFCTGTGLGIVDRCSTDRGSAFIYKDQHSRHYALGMVTYSIGCSLKQKSGIFTRLNLEMDWLNDITDACNSDFI